MANEPKQKPLKSVTIEAVFPELKGIYSMPTGRGQASNVRAAGANAMRDLLKQPGLKGKRFRKASATISFETVGGAEQNARKNVTFANQFRTLQEEHRRVSPLKFLHENSESKVLTRVIPKMTQMTQTTAKPEMLRSVPTAALKEEIERRAQELRRK